MYSPVRRLYPSRSDSVHLQEDAIMNTHAEHHMWQDLPPEDRGFMYEMGVSAIAAAAIVLLLG